MVASRRILGESMDAELYKQLLREAIGGTILGVSLEESAQSIEQKLGPFSANERGPSLLQKGPVQFLLGTHDRVGAIYVEIPDGISVPFGAEFNASPVQPSEDLSLVQARIGAARLDVDRKTGLILSFAVWPYQSDV